MSDTPSKKEAASVPERQLITDLAGAAKLGTLYGKAAHRLSTGRLVFVPLFKDKAVPKVVALDNPETLTDDERRQCLALL